MALALAPGGDQCRYCSFAGMEKGPGSNGTSLCHGALRWVERRKMRVANQRHQSSFQNTIWTQTLVLNAGPKPELFSGVAE
jgi:hypothetical protein